MYEPLIQENEFPFRKVRIITPYSYQHEFKIGKKEAEQSLIQFLVEKFPFRSAEGWTERIAQHLIQINGTPEIPDTILKVGDRVSHLNPAVVEPSVPDEIKLLAENENWISVFKPAPMPMHSGGRYHRNSLKYILEEQLEYPIFLTHRLDAVTSGIVLLAKNKRYAELISEAFRDNKVEKEYRALVKGFPPEKYWTVNKSIRRKTGYVFECTDAKDAKTAFTEFERLEKHGENTLVRCLPKTGRTHQLRLHLLESGYPIIDDETYLYMQKEEIQSIILQKKGIRLCNCKLVIPELGISLEYPIPDSFWEE